MEACGITDMSIRTLCVPQTSLMVDTRPRPRDYAGRMTDEMAGILGEPAYGYFAGGAGDDVTVRDNDASWRRWSLLPRVLVDVSVRDTRVEVLGRTHSHPLVIAPMAYQRHVHPDGELAMARAAAATDTTMVLSSQSTTPVADVAVAGSNRWFQLYVFKDRQVSVDLVQQAKENGYEALVITVDFPVAGWRERGAGFRVTHPVAVSTTGGATAELFAQHDASLTWDDIGTFAEASGMPVLLKGILRPGDASKAMDAGAAGVIVSNHGGRQLDTAVAAADVLESVAHAVRGRGAVLVDGGIRRGWDVAKALALGADAMLVGRPVLWGLARDGQAGAEAVIQQVVAEFDNTLAQLGCPNARDLNRSYVAPSPR